MSTEKYCHRQKTKFTKDLSTCKGVSLTQNASDKEIDTWFLYYLFFDGQSSTDNLICAWNARKIAMIENDRFPENEDEIEDLLAKYIMINKCSIRTLVLYTDDDPTTIYYDPSLWKEAVLLYMYHLKNHNLNDSPEIMKIEYPDDAPYHIFQGILLGYTKESIRDYFILGDKTVNIIISEIAKTTGNRNRNTKKNAQDVYHHLSHTQKREIYMTCYDTVMRENSDIFERLYQEINEYINYKLDYIATSEYKLMALGPDRKMIESFDAHRTQKSHKHGKSHKHKKSLKR